jgi:hypothetical protein
VSIVIFNIVTVIVYILHLSGNKLMETVFFKILLAPGSFLQ